MSKITVVGGGSGAFAVSSDLALHGHEVSLLEHPAFAAGIETIQSKGGITLESLPSSKRGNGFAKLAQITTDPEKALAAAQIVLVVVPGYAQKAMAELCAPYLTAKQHIGLMPGNLYGSIEFLKTLRTCGNSAVECITEFDSLIYTASRKEDSVRIGGYKTGMGVSTFPSRCIEQVSPIFQQLYPGLTLRKNVLATGVSNQNVMIHVPVVVLNCANIERGLDMLADHAAFTEGVGLLVEAIDKERMQLCEHNYADITPISTIMRELYAAQGASGDSLYTIMATNPIYASSKLPTSTNHRYFNEDIPYGIWPIADLLNACGLPNTQLSSLATVAGAAVGRDFYKESRTLASMGLRLTQNELRTYIHNGE